MRICKTNRPRVVIPHPWIVEANNEWRAAKARGDWHATQQAWIEYCRRREAWVQHLKLLNLYGRPAHLQEQAKASFKCPPRRRDHHFKSR